MLHLRDFFEADDVGGHKVAIATSARAVDPRTDDYRDAVIDARQVQRRDEMLREDSPQVRQRFLEWQAALNMLGGSPLLGIGPGRYQEKVGAHYYGLPKLNTREPDTQNGFLVLASTTGFVGLTTFLWIVVHLGSITRIRSDPNHRGTEGEMRGNLDRGLDLGLRGALAAFLGINIFYNASSHHATMLLFVTLAAMISIRGAQHRVHNGEVRQPGVASF
jgi:O-antigen ligase